MDDVTDGQRENDMLGGRDAKNNHSPPTQTNTTTNGVERKAVAVKSPHLSTATANSGHSVLEQPGKMWSPGESLPQPEGHITNSKGEGSQPPVKPKPSSQPQATKFLRAVSQNTYRSYPASKQRRDFQIKEGLLTPRYQIVSTVALAAKFDNEGGLQERLDSRPPLRLDLTGPTPCTYSPRNNPPHHKQAPSFTIGCREKEPDGGGRTAWAKSWTSSPHAWQKQVKFEQKWPDPTSYRQLPSMGVNQPVLPQSKRATIGTLRPWTGDFPISKQPSPGPNHYRPRYYATEVRAPAASLAYSRWHGNTRDQLWTVREVKPSPNKYNPRLYCTRPQRPVYSFPQTPRQTHAKLCTL